MKRYFLSGLVALLPLALTIWIVSLIVSFLTTPFLGMAESLLQALGLDNVSFLFLSPHQVLALLSTILVLVFLFVAIIVIGIVGRQILFKYLIYFGDKILHNIPVVSTVYKTSQELIQTILTTSNKSFKQVVLVPFPTTDSLSIGLITRDDTEIEGRIAVFVPTTPNPTSGFLMMFRREQVIPLDMKVEDALRYVISCGVLITPMKKGEPISIGKSKPEVV
jgi:uncharacterized membrane protein